MLIRQPATFTVREFKLFFLGLVIRFSAVAFLFPTPQQQWFVPFLQHFWVNPSLDAWTSYMATGTPDAFPYGVVMLALLLPGSGIGAWIDGGGADGISLGIRFTLLCADFACLLMLRRFSPGRETSLLLFWWLSPLVLAAIYWSGQLDILPVSLLLGVFTCLYEKKYSLAGLLFSLALSAKFSMAVALPFVLFFFLKARMRPYLRPFLQTFLPTTVVLLGGSLLSPGYVSMVWGTHELTRIFDLQLPLEAHALYLTPTVLAVIAYAAWRLSFLDFKLLTAFTALAMLCVVLGTTTPPGWFLWTWPFLLLHLLPASLSQRFLGLCFSSGAAACQILFWPPPAIGGSVPTMPQLLPSWFGMAHTLLFCVGIMLMAGILRNGIRANRLYRYGTKPISIAIAGDSGVGKDTLATALMDLLPAHDVTHISGDDYHCWDRRGGAWARFTHLNPRANNLRRMFADIDAILDGKRVQRRRYQHEDGHFSQELVEFPRHFLIASGLHALISPSACEKFDIRLFIDMDDALRIAFKSRRDSAERGHTQKEIEQAIVKRQPDSRRYIQPQKQNADVIFLRHLIKEECSSRENLPNYLEIVLRHSLYHEDMARLLVSLCGLHVDLKHSPPLDEVILFVDGEIKGEDMAFVAERLVPELEELIAVAPQWWDGAYGLMQLVCLCQLHQTLKRR